MPGFQDVGDGDRAVAGQHALADLLAVDRVDHRLAHPRVLQHRGGVVQAQRVRGHPLVLLQGNAGDGLHGNGLGRVDRVHVLDLTGLQLRLHLIAVDDLEEDMLEARLAARPVRVGLHLDVGAVDPLLQRERAVGDGPGLEEGILRDRRQRVLAEDVLRQQRQVARQRQLRQPGHVRRRQLDLEGVLVRGGQAGDLHLTDRGRAVLGQRVLTRDRPHPARVAADRGVEVGRQGHQHVG